MFTNNGNILFILILLLVFSFTGADGINDTGSTVLIFTTLALLLSGGNLFGNNCCTRQNQ